MDKHLIVISIDAMVSADIEYAKTLPNFKKIIDGAAIIPSVLTTYPTLTHPIHAVLLAGAPSGRTKVINNLIFNRENPTESVAWHNDLDEIKCDTLLHAAKRAGLSIATSTWPMTTHGEDIIDYLIPNALDYYFEGRDNPLDTYRFLGAGENVIDIIDSAIKKYGCEDRHPEVDFFQFHCAAEIIKKYKPNLLLMHPGNVDSARHKGGVFGEHINKALRDMDTMLGQLLSAIDEAEIADKTDIVLLSDHGQIDIARTVSPNVYLAKKGYITLSESGELISWRAFAKSAGGSAQVYLKNPEDKELSDSVYNLLSEMAEEGIYGFERVYTKNEVEERYGLSGDFSFILETDGYTAFTEQLTPPAVVGYDYGDYTVLRGKHGHAPEKGPQPVFIGSGPSFKSGALIERGNILNHAPTLAAVLGISLKDAVGCAEKEILTV